MNEFPGPQDRIRRVLDNALVDCTYVSSHTEEGGTFVLQARRGDGRGVGVRFRGLRDPEAGSDRQPDPDAPLKSPQRETRRSIAGEQVLSHTQAAGAYVRPC